MIGKYTVLIIRSQTRVSDKLLAKATHLQIIGRAGSGLDNIDLDTAIRHGVLVVHAPRGNTIAVAEHTMALLLALVDTFPRPPVASKRAGGTKAACRVWNSTRGAWNLWSGTDRQGSGTAGTGIRDAGDRQ